VWYARPVKTATLVALVALLASCGGAPAPAEVPQNRAPEPVAAPAGGQYVGNPNASVVLTYWFDYECPHCIAFSPKLDELERTYGDRIVVYYKNYQFPKHPDAHRAAIAAEAARRQGKFIEMHRLLIASSPRFSTSELRALADQLGLDLDHYDADVADPSAAALVDRDYAEGDAAGIQGVPTLYINGVEVVDSLEPSALSAKIDALL
jgi:protein-disulfide isomerase